jgi:hypothetical protein
MFVSRKSLKIRNGKSKAINQIRQTIHWSKEKEQKEKQ